MHITLLHVGETPARLRDRFERYPPLFQDMFRDAGARFSWREIHVLDGEELPDPVTLDGVVITGSAFGVYDRTPWMAPMRAFIRNAYGQKTKMVGVCFGHQIMADALGGDVGKSEKGWGIGRHTYRLDGSAKELGIGKPALSIACSHQDQVLAPPREAQVFMASDFTPHAGLIYDNGAAISVQPHPEFERPIAKALCDLRRDNPLSGDTVDKAIAGLDEPLDRIDLASALARFLMR